jgi:hypothetical protein
MSEADSTLAENRVRLRQQLEENPALARDLVDDPASVFGKLNLNEAALRCTDADHELMARMDKAAAEVETLDGDQPLQELLPQIGSIASAHLGADYEVRPAPFGLLFAEKAGPGVKAAATAGVTCTFGLKCRPDFD